MEPPPNIWEFGRYERHAKPASKIPAIHATRVQLGEIIDLSVRPPQRVFATDAQMAYYKGCREPLGSGMTVGEVVRQGEAYAELSKDECAKDRDAMSRVPGSGVQPLTCPGLALHRHPLSSTPSMGFRPPTSPTLPLPEWQPTMRRVEFAHLRPGESDLYGGQGMEHLAGRQPMSIGGCLPDRQGHFTETQGRYGRGHAALSMADLNQRPFHPTHWSKENLAKRSQSFRSLRRARVRWLACGESGSAAGNRLYRPTTMRLAPEEVAKGDDLRKAAEAILLERKSLQRDFCGLGAKSKKQQLHNRAAALEGQAARARAVADHVVHHDEQSLMHRIAFEKFDADGSGTIDKAELEAALAYMGLEVGQPRRGETDKGANGGTNGVIDKIMQKYDADGNGTLSLEEFTVFSREAMRDPDTQSLFLSKKSLLKHTARRVYKDVLTVKKRSGRVSREEVFGNLTPGGSRDFGSGRGSGFLEEGKGSDEPPLS